MIYTGKHVNFELHGGVHAAAVILKSFLREMPEPIMTFELFDHAIRIPSKLTPHHSCCTAPQDAFLVLLLSSFTYFLFSRLNIFFYFYNFLYFFFHIAWETSMFFYALILPKVVYLSFVMFCNTCSN